MTETTLTQEQQAAAALLKEGDVVFSYRDGNSIRMETEMGRDPYVWRDGAWRRMRAG